MQIDDVRYVQRFGEAVRTTRLNRGMTQEQLATDSQVGIRTVVRVEQGEGVMLGTVARLAGALGLHPSGLLTVAELEGVPTRLDRQGVAS